MTSTLSPVSEDGFKAILRQFPSRQWMLMRAPHLHEPSTLSFQNPPSMQEVPSVTQLIFIFVFLLFFFTKKKKKELTMEEKINDKPMWTLCNRG